MFISRKLQHGFSMVEVLVSLVVISVGILGLSGLQIASMKGTNNAHSRNIANMLAMEFGDRMRANPIGVEGGFYNASVTCKSKETQCRGNKFCTPEQTAKFDIQEVMCGMFKSNKSKVRFGGAANLLPNGTLQVSCDAGCEIENAIHNVTLNWSESIVHKDQAENALTQTITVPIIP